MHALENEDFLVVRSCGIHVHILRDRDKLFLIDAGFIAGVAAFDRAIKEKGWEHLTIEGIVLTHGHIDHIAHAAFLAKRHGAWIAGPEADLAYYQGKACYKGLGKLVGVGESLARLCLPFEAFTPDRLLNDGDSIDIWGGLEVIALPGHTAGHCGFYSTKLDLVFAGDTFASYGRWSHFPPFFFNADNEMVHKSARKLLDRFSCGLLPNHSDGESPAVHRERLEKLVAKKNKV